MTAKQVVAEKLPANAEYPTPTPWADTERELAEGQWYLLATLHATGRPHVRPVLAVWLDGALYFCSNDNARKAKNLAHDPHCTISVAKEQVHLVVEGKAIRVSDEAKLQRVAQVYATKYDWHVTVRDGAFYADYGAPTAGPSPYKIYELKPATVYGFGTDESYSPTRWRF